MKDFDAIQVVGSTRQCERRALEDSIETAVEKINGITLARRRCLRQQRVFICQGYAPLGCF